MIRRPTDDPAQDVLDFVPERPDAEAAGDGEEFHTPHRGRLLVSVALGLSAVVATVVTVWYIFADQSADVGKNGLPIIVADPGPVKARPADPGGMEVPNQDKLVYERLGQSDVRPRAERLLPPPEAPLPPPVTMAPPSLATPRASVENLAAATEPPAAVPAPVVPSVTVQETAEALPPPEVLTTPSADPKLAPVAAAPATPEVSTPAPVTPEPAAPAAQEDGGWRVQIAAVRDRDIAEKEWSRLATAHRDLLGRLSADIMRADLGAKGIFYRVRGGPLDEATARRICSDLGKRKIGCMVVRK